MIHQFPIPREKCPWCREPLFKAGCSSLGNHLQCMNNSCIRNGSIGAFDISINDQDVIYRVDFHIDNYSILNDVGQKTAIYHHIKYNRLLQLDDFSFDFSSIDNVRKQVNMLLVFQ